MELESQRCDQSSMESAQDLVRKFRPLLQLMAARSGDHEKLLGEVEHAAAEAAVIAGWPRDVVIDLEAASEGDTQLHQAAASGDDDCYIKCAEVAWSNDRSRLLARNGDGDTPLHCAARAGHSGMVKHLIKLAQGEGEDRDTAKVMVRARNHRGETALHEAVRSGDEDMVGDLMAVDNQLARVIAQDGASPLFLAISMGHHRLARSLYDKSDKAALSYSGPEGQNALHAAALLGFRQKKAAGMAKRLLEWNPNLARQQDESGSTSLHFAASAEDPTLELFLFVFAERDFESYSLTLALSILLPKKWVYKFYKWRENPTFVLVDANPLSAFQPDRNGLYPVHVAACAGSLVPIIILLCHSRGCAGLRDGQGRTFLHIAVEKKVLNIVWFAARKSRYKAIVNIQDHEGNTALHLAVRGGSWDIFRILIGNKHVRLNLTNKKGETPMDIALSEVPPTGFYFGLHARRRILATLTLANAEKSYCRRDRHLEQHVPKLDEAEESQKITSFAQIVGVGSVLVATATFAAAFTMPGGPSNDQNTPPIGKGGTPTLASFYAFHAFVISNTLAFICSTLATFSLVYTGVAAVDIEKRIKLVAFSLALLISAARSFCAAFAFAIYVVLPPKVANGTAMAACVMTVLALMDAFWFMLAIVTDTTVLLSREDWGSISKRLMKLGGRVLANIVYVFWPYIVIFGLLASKWITGTNF